MWRFVTNRCGCSTAKPKLVEGAPPAQARPSNTLYRDEVESAKHAGLGHFFELVDFERKATLTRRAGLAVFRVFKLLTLRPATQWLSFDFAPATILTTSTAYRLNTIPLWFEQFEALSTADQIRVI